MVLAKLWLRSYISWAVCINPNTQRFSIIVGMTKNTDAPQQQRSSLQLPTEAENRPKRVTAVLMYLSLFFFFFFLWHQNLAFKLLQICEEVSTPFYLLPLGLLD